MEQNSLFVEDIYQALSDCVRAAGGNKAVAAVLWPDKSVLKQQVYLNDCLNRERNEKLDPEQILFILKLAKEKGCHVGMDFINESCDYEPPKPVNKKEKRAELQQEFIRAVGVIDNLKSQLIKLDSEDIS